MRVVRILSAILPLGLSVISCSVKEDRQFCPCLLTIDFTKARDERYVPASAWDNGLIVEVFSMGQIVCKEIYRLENVSNLETLQVDRGDVTVVCIAGLDRASMSMKDISTPSGNQSDHLYVFSEAVSCREETAFVYADMYKQYTDVHVREALNDPDQRISFDGFSLIARSRSNPLDIIFRKASEGVFECELDRQEDGYLGFSMPRQHDRSVTIEMYRPDGSRAGVIPLAQKMTEAGYDWDAISLGDVYVTVDMAALRFYVSVEGWNDNIIGDISL